MVHLSANRRCKSLGRTWPTSCLRWRRKSLKRRQTSTSRCRISHRAKTSTKGDLQVAASAGKPPLLETLVPTDLAAFVLFLQPAHQRFEIFHHRASGYVFAGGFL